MKPWQTGKAELLNDEAAPGRCADLLGGTTLRKASS